MRTIFVCRKPIRGTNVQNALTYGSAGLNINASRVGVEGDGQDLADRSKREGRWPPNVLLQHRSGCVHQGTRAVVAASVDSPPPIRRTGVHATSGGHQKIGRVQPAFRGYGGPDGLEQVDDWACVPGCPVPLVDGQSRGSVTASREALVEGTRGLSNNHKSTEYPGESGGVSRFFKQIQEKP